MLSSLQRRLLAVCAARDIANKNQATTHRSAVTNSPGHGLSELQNNEFISHLFTGITSVLLHNQHWQGYCWGLKLSLSEKGRKYLAQEPAWSALPAVLRGLGDEQSLRPPHCWAWWWLPHGSIYFSSWASVAFLYGIFSILCKLLGHLKYQIRGYERKKVLRRMLFP